MSNCVRSLANYMILLIFLSDYFRRLVQFFDFFSVAQSIRLLFYLEHNVINKRETNKIIKYFLKELKIYTKSDNEFVAYLLKNLKAIEFEPTCLHYIDISVFDSKNYRKL